MRLAGVTLMGIDCVHPRRTLTSMAITLRQIWPERSVLVTNSENREICGIAKKLGIDIVHYVSTTREDYEYSMLQFQHAWFSTKHVLFQEWDGFVVNNRAWNQEFLKYDYIGAPWSRQVMARFSGCNNAVGNGGFCLKSWEWTREVSKHVDRADKLQLISDAWACRIMYPKVKHKLKIAPVRLAENFACEDMYYSGQFGIHGDVTLRMNGWSVDAVQRHFLPE